MPARPLARSGIVSYEQSNDYSLRLPALTVDECAALARQVLDFYGGSPTLATTVAELTIDCPAATVLGSRLVAAGRTDPRLLRSEHGFGEMLLRTFREELLGNIAKVGDERDLRALLDVVALVQPVDPDDPRFLELAEHLLGRPADAVVGLMGTLDRSGLLRRCGRMRRVVPNVLADHLVEEAGLDPGRAVRTFSHAMSTYRLNLVRNLARLDWQASATTGAHLLDATWGAIQREFRAADNLGRCELLSGLSDVSRFQPVRAIELAEIAIDEPADDREDTAWPWLVDSRSTDWVPEAIPGFLRGATYSIDDLPEVLRLLWESPATAHRSVRGEPRAPSAVPIRLGGRTLAPPPSRLTSVRRGSRLAPDLGAASP